jgi:hypothetical protein
VLLFESVDHTTNTVLCSVISWHVMYCDCDCDCGLRRVGHGKSTLLKVLSNRIVDKSNIGGEILYNGISSHEVKERNWCLNKLLAYVYQADVHLSTLTGVYTHLSLALSRFTSCMQKLVDS